MKIYVKTVNKGVINVRLAPNDTIELLKAILVDRYGYTAGKFTLHLRNDSTEEMMDLETLQDCGIVSRS
jgi:hypothetical protein